MLGVVCATLLSRGALAEQSITIKRLTTDVQVAANGTATQTIHSEVHVTNAAAAIRIGQTSVSYVASLQSMQIVQAYTLKPGGAKIAVDVSAIYDQMPPGSQTAMLTDQRVKVIVFPQFAAGDTAVYTVRIVTRQPYFVGQYWYGDLYPRFTAFGDVRETITAPKSLHLFVETHGIAFSKQDLGSKIAYSWHYSGLPPIAPETKAVSPIDSEPRFFVSSFKDYRELGRAYAAVSKPKMTVTPAISALANQITHGVRDRRAQAQKIYEWVSKHIRYVAIELGTGSFVPHDAEAILTNGYGDCKDHVVLLGALLKAKGIESESVLINGTNAYTLTKVPTFAQLNHVITWIPEFKLYLDSSATIAPFGVLPTQEYGKPIVRATLPDAVLDTMPVLPANLATVATKTVSRLDKNGILTGTTRTTASGPFSIALRLMGLGIQNLGSEAAAAEQLASLGYAGATGKFDVGSPTDLAPNYTILGTFVSPGWNANLSGSESFHFPGGLRLLGLSGDGAMGPLYSRKASSEPIVCLSVHASEEISLQAPPGIHFSEVPKDTKVETPYLRFTAHWALANTTLAVHRDFLSKIDKPLCTAEIRKRNETALKQISDSYDTAISFESSDSAASITANSGPAARAWNDFNAGVKAAKSGNLDSAIQSYTNALSSGKLTPDNTYRALWNRGTAYFSRNRFQDAVEDFSAALRLQPNEANNYAMRAQAYQRLKNNAAALNDYKAYARLEPNDSDIWITLADLNLQTGHYKDAIAGYSAVLRTHPNDVNILATRGTSYEKDGDYDDATADFRRALALNDPDPTIPGLLCETLSRSRKPSNAIPDCNRALQKDPDLAIASSARGYAYFRLAQYANALRDFSAAARAYPQRADYLYAQGVAKKKLGDNSGGDRDISVARQMSPNVMQEMSALKIVP